MIQRMWPGGVQPETAQPVHPLARDTEVQARRETMTIESPMEVVIYVPYTGSVDWLYDRRGSQSGVEVVHGSDSCGRTDDAAGQGHLATDTRKARGTTLPRELDLNLNPTLEPIHSPRSARRANTRRRPPRAASTHAPGGTARAGAACRRGMSGHSDDRHGDLTRLDADVECAERHRDARAAGADAELSQRAGEAEAVDQAERERQLPARIDLARAPGSRDRQR